MVVGVSVFPGEAGWRLCRMVRDTVYTNARVPVQLAERDYSPGHVEPPPPPPPEGVTEHPVLRGFPAASKTVCFP